MDHPCAFPELELLTPKLEKELECGDGHRLFGFRTERDPPGMGVLLPLFTREERLERSLRLLEECEHGRKFGELMREG
jgi:hypothetical protein